MLLTDFQILRPPFETSQEQTLEWFIDAHTKAESAKGITPEELALFHAAIKEKMWHVGCKPDRIEKRGHVLADYLHRNWDEMEVFRLHEQPGGTDLSHRIKIYEREVDKVFEDYYPESASAPDDLIHVSCTGYLSPSGAQKIVSLRNWGNQTVVTHAYHMGCYGAFPAIRMARGFLNTGRKKKRVDIVHTELCSLQANPSQHRTDQLVSQSLFSDGYIKYSVSKKVQGPHLKILSVEEEIIPDSCSSMTWNLADWGMQISLAKEVPVLIARHLPGYLKRLCGKGMETVLKKALFAIHPGGPKILMQIQQLLGLADSQMRYSFEILKNYGNMSSGTLPHIWQAILEREKENLPVVSLAFGPGLSISGSLMERVCGP